MNATKVLLVSEWDDDLRRAPGYALRLRTVFSWLDADPSLEVTRDILNHEAKSGGTARLRRVASALRRISRETPRDAIIVVAGLNSPHMTLFAALLALRRSVVVDVCDAVTLTLRNVRTDGIRERYFSALSQMLFVWASRRRVCRLYISEHDRTSDDSALRNERSITVWPQPVVELQGLTSYHGPAERIVIPADLRSYHNRVVFDALAKQTRSGRGPKLPIDIYGPDSHETMPNGMIHRGWAAQITAVYEGQTLVMAPNLRSAGIQNKVWEALSAGRPVVVGRDAAGSFANLPGVFTFSSISHLVQTIDEAAAWRSEGFSKVMLPENEGSADSLLSAMAQQRKRFSWGRISTSFRRKSIDS